MEEKIVRKEFSMQDLLRNVTSGGGAFSAFLGYLDCCKIFKKNYNSDVLHYYYKGKYMRVKNLYTLSSSISELQSQHSSCKINKFDLVYLLKKRAAFTLAEVLITLGIIGVVAAMTMPSLIANYQNRVLLTAVKKTYSVFNNAVKLALSDRESTDIITVFDTANTSLQTTETLQKYFNGAVLCTKSSTLCPAYSVKAQYGKKNAVTGASVYQSSMAPPYLKLVDGSFIKINQHSSCITERPAQRCKEDSSGNVIPNSDGTDCEYEDYTWIDTRCAMVQIDTNGIKAPNQYGADIYQIGIYENGKINGVASNGRLDTVLSTDGIDYIKYNVDD